MRIQTPSLILAGFVCVCFVCDGASAKVKVQTISEGKAASLCKGHGGGTDCSFCHSGHCHEVSCNGKLLGGSCTNTVTSNLRGQPGKIRAPVKGVKNGNSGAPPKGGTHHPVKVDSGLHPVVNSNESGGNKVGRRH